MENKALYTRCPTCSTAFKVTDKLLAMANGKVRCGACLSIFQATDYMLERKNKPSPAEENSVEQKPTVEQPLVTSAPPVEEISNNQVIEQQELLSTTHIKDTTNESVIESEIEPELESDIEPELESDIEPELEADIETELESDIEPGLESDIEPGLESDIEPELESDIETESQLEFPSEQELNFPDEDDHQEYELGDPYDDSELDDPELDNITLDESDTKNHDFEEEENYEELSEQLNEQLLDTDSDPDPLDEFNDIVEEKKTGIKTKLAILVVAILVFIGLQQVWSNRQALAWSESWGSTTKSICGILPCDLKAQKDVSKIKLLQRQLSPNDELENVLDIKVLLVNEAKFDQPYPTIKIIFSNQNGEQVSVKSFPPYKYLEATAIDELMPSGSEVHINFKTEVTRPDALGFEFVFE